MRHLWLLLTLLPAPFIAQQGDSYSVTHTTQLRSAPDVKSFGQLSTGTVVEVLARDHGWARVRTEGWVHETDLTPVDTAFSATLSAADLRADPEGTRGKVVQWTVEFLALQVADPLRHGFADEEPYILARGPGNENAILYLVIPPSLMSTAHALQPLTKIAVTARVRDGHSAPVGIPILDIQSMQRLK
jgi:hypothetical protein